MPINTQTRQLLDQYKNRKIGEIFRFQSHHHPSGQFKLATTLVGIEARFHDLRHTFGTNLVKAGVDIRTIQKLMRHQDLQSTLVYAKVLPDQLKEAAEKIQ